MKRNFCADSPLLGQHGGTAPETRFAEKGREYKEEVKIYPQFCNSILVGLKSKGELLPGKLPVWAAKFSPKVQESQEFSPGSGQGWTLVGKA